jgi:hypothetical protein
MDTAFAGTKAANSVDLFRYVLRQIEMPQEQLLSSNVEALKDAFEDWALDAWQGLSRVVLIIDGLDRVLGNSNTDLDIHQLVNWLGELRSQAALGDPPHNQLILFTALTGKMWNAAHASPHASQAETLMLEKFSEPQVVQAFEQLGVSLDRHEVQDVYALFHGHPYLTQVFAWSMRDGASVKVARDAALSMKEPYGAHWDRLKAEVRFMSSDKYHLYTILAAISETYHGASIRPVRKVGNNVRNISPKTILNQYGRNLRILGLLDETGDQQSVCEFYRSAMNREVG